MASIVIDFTNDSMLNTLHHNALGLMGHATAEFWMYVFNKLVFPGRNYVTSTQQLPAEYGTPRQVDVVVKKLQEGNLSIVLWKEDKLARAGPEDIAQVETQGFSAGFKHLQTREPQREAVWVMTGYGPHSKLWAYSKAHEEGMLVPIWPHKCGHGERDSYLNLRGNERVFEWLFEFIKANPFPTPDFVDRCRDRKVSGFLVDASNDIYVKVIAIENGHVKCEGLHGTTLHLGTSWYKSHIVGPSNQLEHCWHIIHESDLYWTYDLNPPSH